MLNNEYAKMEAFSATNMQPLRWEYREEIQGTTYDMSETEKQNGYYLVKDIQPLGATSQVKLLKVKLPYGYYRVDDTNMAQIPYGYLLEKQGDDVSVDYTKRIVPKTSSAIYSSATPAIGKNSVLSSSKPLPIPASGIPDGMYMREDKNTMAILPPGMKANISLLKVEGAIYGPTLSKTFSPGYISEPEYYNKKYMVDLSQQKIQNNVVQNVIVPLPPEIYYSEGATDTDLKNSTSLNVQFLPYGKVAKTLNGVYTTGYVDNPNLISKTGKFDYNNDYSTIQNNIDVQFHDSVEDLKKQNDMYDLSFGSITVLDQTGNLVVLPRSQIQGDITFHRPDAFLFGASTYVPKYEDSVYLSRSSHMPTMAEYRSAFKTVGFCEEQQRSPFKMEEKCNNLSAETCASTSCCVLLGGAKCVSGSETGPAMKQNYSDLFVRNKDYYTHMGKCYGNCP